MATSKPKPGSAEAKKEFYTAQRLKADKDGDTAMQGKIYGKLNEAKYGKSLKNAQKRNPTAFTAPTSYNGHKGK